MACVGQYRKLAACIFYNTPILWLLSITYQAGVPYNALTWLVWVSTESWLRVFFIIPILGCLHGLCSVPKVGFYNTPILVAA